ncbi:MAG: sigma-70 family RNA polymerase sigma factor [Acidobacteria bacterium]|nr:sigma-70 family RNA polymerase sigma factor [Acidobacteriota bacterium]
MSVTLETKKNSILPRVAAGDETAVAECLDRYGNLVWALARQLTPRREDAEDAVQEIFMEIWQNAGRYDAAKSAESTFITLIARRRLIDRLRKIYRRPAVQSIEDTFETAPNVFESHLYTKIQARQAVKAMKTLRPEQREMMILNIYDGMSHGEISERLNVPLGTVKTHIRRGFQRVRETLGRTAPRDQYATV